MPKLLVIIFHLETYNPITSVGLKASTLKQLGQAVLQQPMAQEITVKNKRQMLSMHFMFSAKYNFYIHRRCMMALVF